MFIFLSTSVISAYTHVYIDIFYFIYKKIEINMLKMPSILGKWSKNNDGATAVEFSLVGVPFIFMVIGIIGRFKLILSNMLRIGVNSATFGN